MGLWSFFLLTSPRLPSTSQIRGVSISASGVYTVLSIHIGLQVKFDGSGFLEIELPRAYYGKVRKTPGSPTRGGAPYTLEQESDTEYAFLFRVEKGKPMRSALPGWPVSSVV